MQRIRSYLDTDPYGSAVHKGPFDAPAHPSTLLSLVRSSPRKSAAWFPSRWRYWCGRDGVSGQLRAAVAPLKDQASTPCPMVVQATGAVGLTATSKPEPKSPPTEGRSLVPSRRDDLRMRPDHAIAARTLVG
jgi:hypothetical protein